MLALTATLTLVAGLALAALGWNGRLAHREPRCRACGYILTGISHVTSCTECGANFIGAQSPYIRETRRPRPLLLALGVALALASIGVLTALVADALL